MNLIFAKLYEEYIRKNYPAKFSITMYISIVYFFFSSILFLPIKTFVDKQILDNQFYYEKTSIMIVVFGQLTIITCLVYYRYIRKKHIEILVKKYQLRKINKTLLYLFVVATPVTLLLIAATITVFINGGEILGNRIEEIFN